MNPSYKYIIATTSIINGETALTQLLGPGTEAQDQGLAVPDILKEKWNFRKWVDYLTNHILKLLIESKKKEKIPYNLFR